MDQLERLARGLAEVEAGVDDELGLGHAGGDQAGRGALDERAHGVDHVVVEVGVEDLVLGAPLVCIST